MNQNIQNEFVFKLPPIEFAKRSGVKKLDVTVLAKVDNSMQLYEYLSQMVLKEFEKENT